MYVWSCIIGQGAREDRALLCENWLVLPLPNGLCAPHAADRTWRSLTAVWRLLGWQPFR